MNTMLPTDRPISSRIFAAMPDHLGILVSDWLWLCGLTPGKWGKIRADARHERTADRPLGKPFLGIMARWMHQNTEALPTLRGPEPDDVFRRLRAALGRSISQKEFAVLMGYDATTANRWINGVDDPARGPRHALAMIDSPDPQRLAANWREWCRLAAIEAEGRGFPDLKKARGWTPSSSKRRRVRGGSGPPL
jgi:hypothetical protein